MHSCPECLQRHGGQQICYLAKILEVLERIDLNLARLLQREQPAGASTFASPSVHAPVSTPVACTQPDGYAAEEVT